MRAQPIVVVLVVLALAGSGIVWWLARSEEGPGAVPAPVASRPVEPAPASGELAPARPLAAAGEAGEREALRAREEPRRARGTRDSAAAAEDAREGPRIRGRVVDRTGAPVAGARVLASDQPGSPLDIELDALPSSSSSPLSSMRRFTATTDAGGWFELTGPRPGDLRLVARAPGFAPLRREGIAVPAGDEVELAPLVMSRGAILTGRVLDERGRGLAGARITAVDDESRVVLWLPGARGRVLAESAEDGSFRVDELACGPWSLLVDHEQHPPRVFEGSAEEPGVEVGGLELRLEPGERIAGRVTGVPEGESAGLLVRATKVDDGPRGRASAIALREADVAGDGTFEIVGVEAGADYDLQLRESRELGETMFWGRPRSERVRARAGERGVEIAYQPEAALRFQVVDARTGAPITEFVAAVGIGRRRPLEGEDGRTLGFHPDGRARAGGLRPYSPDDRAELEIRATGYRTHERDDIRIALGEERDLGTIALEPVPLVRVRVRDTAGDPVEGALVQLTEEEDDALSATARLRFFGGDEEEEVPDGRSARTDAEGRAALSSLEGQTCRLQVSTADHALWELTGLYLPPGQGVEQEVVLTGGGRVLVRVLGPDGEPVAGTRVQHRPPGAAEVPFDLDLLGAGERAVTDSEGMLLFERLQPGVHAFRLDEGESGVFGRIVIRRSGPGEAEEDPGWTEVRVEEGALRELLLVAEPRAALAGRIREAGRPLAGATLALRAEGEGGRPSFRLPRGLGGGPEVRTDGAGEYRIDGTKTGRHLLSITHPTRSMPAEYELTLRAGENSLDVDLPVAVIEGTVTDEEGRPVAGLRVSAERYAEEPATRISASFSFVMADGEGSSVVSIGGGADGPATTDASGHYVLRGVLPDADLRVKAEGEDVQPGWSEPVRVRPDEVERGVDVSVAPGGAIEVEVFASDGSPARLCTVRASWAGETEEGAEPVEPRFAFIQSGTTVLRGLRPGRWTVRVQRAGPGARDGDGEQEQTIEVRARETVPSTFRLQ
jgi:protocatechuate 3,4-dioxygenase beta subunit